MIYVVYTCEVKESCSTITQEKEIKKSLIHNGVLYFFIISNTEFSVKITKQFENWITKYPIREMMNLPQWRNLINSAILINFISNAIENIEFDAYLLSPPLLIFKMKTGIEGISIDFNLHLTHIPFEAPHNFQELTTLIWELESRIDQKFIMIEDKIEGKNL